MVIFGHGREKLNSKAAISGHCVVCSSGFESNNVIFLFSNFLQKTHVINQEFQFLAILKSLVSALKPVERYI